MHLDEFDRTVLGMDAYRAPGYQGGAVTDTIHMSDDGGRTVIYELPERAEDLATEMHEDGAPLVAVLSESARIAVAEELRRLADDPLTWAAVAAVCLLGAVWAWVGMP